MGRSTTNISASNKFNAALIAVGNLFDNAFASLDSYAGRVGLQAHSEIKNATIARKSAVFYQHYLPLRQQMSVLLADTYRRFYRLALANSGQIKNQPERWAWTQLQPALHAALEWIREWYTLACEGENQTIRLLSSTPVVQSGTISVPIPTSVPPLLPWRAPSWLFGISLAIFGIGVLKQKHVPNMDSEERLNEAYTRLLLKGARRVFLWDLQGVCETVRNEEIAAAGSLPAETETRQPIKRQGWEAREKLYRTIQKILAISPEIQGMQFCAELDKRHAEPLFDWKKSGDWREGLTWKEAWKNTNLRRKIRRVRQEAQRQPQ